MDKGKWIGGLATWDEGDTLYLSVAFTWELDRAYAVALFARAIGKNVVAGGPALFSMKMQHVLTDVAEIADHYPEAVTKHNPMATFASRGCPVGCGFCIVPAMEGREFTFIPDFTPRPVLCDNNRLIALSSTSAKRAARCLTLTYPARSPDALAASSRSSVETER